jgi:hypothetical protein
VPPAVCCLLQEIPVILCPVCSSEVDSVARLVRCEGCIWDDQGAAYDARRRLAAFRRGAGDHAYGADGCRVCEACRGHFRRRASLCPLVLFYNAPGGQPDSEPEEEQGRFLDEVEEYWNAYLHTYDYPEHVEGYWRRLTQSVTEPATGC